MSTPIAPCNWMPGQQDVDALQTGAWGPDLETIATANTVSLAGKQQVLEQAGDNLLQASCRFAQALHKSDCQVPQHPQGEDIPQTREYSFEALGFIPTNAENQTTVAPGQGKLPETAGRPVMTGHDDSKPEGTLPQYQTVPMDWTGIALNDNPTKTETIPDRTAQSNMTAEGPDTPQSQTQRTDTILQAPQGQDAQPGQESTSHMMTLPQLTDVTPATPQQNAPAELGQHKTVSSAASTTQQLPEEIKPEARPETPLGTLSTVTLTTTLDTSSLTLNHAENKPSEPQHNTARTELRQLDAPVTDTASSAPKQPAPNTLQAMPPSAMPDNNLSPATSSPFPNHVTELPHAQPPQTPQPEFGPVMPPIVSAPDVSSQFPGTVPTAPDFAGNNTVPTAPPDTTSITAHPDHTLPQNSNLSQPAVVPSIHSPVGETSTTTVQNTPVLSTSPQPTPVLSPNSETAMSQVVPPSAARPTLTDTPVVSQDTFVSGNLPNSVQKDTTPLKESDQLPVAQTAPQPTAQPHESVSVKKEQVLTAVPSDKPQNTPGMLPPQTDDTASSHPAFAPGLQHADSPLPQTVHQQTADWVEPQPQFQMSAPADTAQHHTMVTPQTQVPIPEQPVVPEAPSAMAPSQGLVNHMMQPQPEHETTSEAPVLSSQETTVAQPPVSLPGNRLENSMPQLAPEPTVSNQQTTDLHQWPQQDIPQAPLPHIQLTENQGMTQLESTPSRPQQTADINQPMANLVPGQEEPMAQLTQPPVMNPTTAGKDQTDLSPLPGNTSTAHQMTQPLDQETSVGKTEQSQVQMATPQQNTVTQQPAATQQNTVTQQPAATQQNTVTQQPAATQQNTVTQQPADPHNAPLRQNQVQATGTKAEPNLTAGNLRAPSKKEEPRNESGVQVAQDPLTLTASQLGVVNQPLQVMDSIAMPQPIASQNVSNLTSLSQTSHELLTTVIDDVADSLLTRFDPQTGIGEVRLILKPAVLNGTEIRLTGNTHHVDIAFFAYDAKTVALISSNQMYIAETVASRTSMSIKVAVYDVPRKQRFSTIA